MKSTKKRATKKNSIRGKFNQLKDRIVSYNSSEGHSVNMEDLKWVEEWLELDLEVYPPSRQDLEKANTFWKQYAPIG